jgi:hypothetical protein
MKRPEGRLKALYYVSTVDNLWRLAIAKTTGSNFIDGRMQWPRCTKLLQRLPGWRKHLVTMESMHQARQEQGHVSTGRSALSAGVCWQTRFLGQSAQFGYVIGKEIRVVDRYRSYPVGITLVAWFSTVQSAIPHST